MFIDKNNFQNVTKKACDNILKQAMLLGANDNVSCIFIGFENYFNTLNYIFFQRKNIKEPVKKIDKIDCETLIDSIIPEKNLKNFCNEPYFSKHLSTIENTKKLMDNFYKSSSVDPKKTSKENYQAQLNK